MELVKPYFDLKAYFVVLFGFAGLLLPLSITTSVHEAPSRYPDELRNLGIDYKETELVRNMKILISHIKDNIEQLDCLIKDQKERKIKLSLIFLRLIEPYLKDIDNLKSDEEKLEVINEVIEGIKCDEENMKEIEKIRSHEWIKVIEGEEE